MVLQTIFGSGYEVNTDIGREYHLVSKERCMESFKELAKEEFGENIKHFIDTCYMFIVHDNGSSVIPLYKEHAHHIRAESGLLFKDLTFK